ncbi:flagellar motor switch protein FliN [Cellulomonas sp.]|uniref:flagellar motor switch protein FliN n=1 Tax=Cellulomonas sp. TaxID=40001 RepID=UPI0028117C30|nr:flagellar motor switch protein FliN [Cellulomonas sp.]
MNPTATAGAAAARAAAAAASLVPAPVPLTAVPAAEAPPADAPAVVAPVVGQRGGEVVVVLGPAVVQALAEGAVAGASLDPAEALRPALAAAAAELGDGVLGAARSATAGDAVAGDAHVFALQGDGATLAWCAVRVRAEEPAPRAAVPTQRGAHLRVLYDVEMTLTAELGRTKLPLKQVLDLTPGAVLELDRTAGSPADIVVNGRLIARGEVVVVDEDYGVRVTEIVAGSDPA